MTTNSLTKLSHDGSIEIITLDKAKKHNTLSHQMANAIAANAALDTVFVLAISRVR
jgi:enoyl-CoA hydratase/carnithine racemase